MGTFQGGTEGSEPAYRVKAGREAEPRLKPREEIGWAADNLGKRAPADGRRYRGARKRYPQRRRRKAAVSYWRFGHERRETKGV